MCVTQGPGGDACLEVETDIGMNGSLESYGTHGPPCYTYWEFDQAVPVLRPV